MGRRQRICQLIKALEPAGDQDEIIASRGKAIGIYGTDSGGCSGDDGDWVG
jgi:hypothetical protein